MHTKRKRRFYAFCGQFIGRALVVVAAYMGSVPLMIAFTAVAAFGMGHGRVI